MARIAGVNIPTQKRVPIALQYIHGIGPHFAGQICDALKIEQRSRGLAPTTATDVGRNTASRA